MKPLVSVLFTLMSPALFAFDGMTGDWEIGLGAGALFPNVDGAMISSGEGWPDDAYHVNQEDTTALFTAFLGYQWADDDADWLSQLHLRLNYFYGLSSTISGRVQQFSLPEYENYDFDYDAQTQALLGTLKVNIYQYQQLSPFIVGGVGAAWNKFSDYSEDALTGITPRVSPDFSDHTHADFSFLVGAGLDYFCSEDFTLSLEYNYLDTGEIKSGTSDVYIDEQITSDINNSIILLSINYVL